MSPACAGQESKMMKRPVLRQSQRGFPFARPSPSACPAKAAGGTGSHPSAPIRDSARELVGRAPTACGHSPRQAQDRACVFASCLSPWRWYRPARSLRELSNRSRPASRSVPGGATDLSRLGHVRHRRLRGADLDGAHTLLVLSEPTGLAGFRSPPSCASRQRRRCFWLFTFPINVAMPTGAGSPAQFEAARRQWEYSHAAGAVLTLVALLALIASLLRANPRAPARQL